ncbi:ATP-binding protein [Sandaracinus amylolyticus]|nr:helicase HerA-like domain-containing protein [Sandaracinus amylolyticus]
MTARLRLGARHSIDGRHGLGAFELPAHHLLTHAVVVGMTGSGKTGLVTVMVEEALRAEIPVLVIDVKGDLPNLALAFPSFDPALMAPWVEPTAGDEDGVADEPVVLEAARQREEGLRAWEIGEDQLAELEARSTVRVLTPGSDAGEPLHLLSALERRSSRWDHDVAGARAALSAAISLVLRLTGRDGDPGKSREHALLSVLAEARLRRGESAPLDALVPEILEPPIGFIGALPVDAFVPARLRGELAADLNTLIASPSFASWRTGRELDVGAWMEKVDGKTPATIVSVAHLDDEERALVLGVVLEEVLTWVRSLPGSARLRALIVFDEVFGFIPPHPASPPTKRPLVALMKQARAYGVGCVLATQNPMDLDYRALSNAGTWVLGRLQTDADRARVVEALGEDEKKSQLGALVKKLSHRWFVVRDAKAPELCLLQPRWAMSYLRGPMTQSEIRRARAPR